jgi:hypothetical protein
MKRIYSIGRDESCDIVIYDVTNVVSRNHATLRVDGKRCYLTDQSTNGTYRNGIRLTPYVEYPVSPKDEISLGNVVNFDWDAIPALKKKTTPVWLYVFLPLAILLLAGCCYYFWTKTKAEAAAPDSGQEAPAAVPTDTLDAVSSAETPKTDSLVVLENVMAPKKAARTTTRKNKKKADPGISQKVLDDYKDSDDEILQDAL